MKEAVTKVIDMLTEEDFHVAFQKLLEQYKCIAAGGDYFHVWTINKSALTKKNLETYRMPLVQCSTKQPDGTQNWEDT